MTCQECGRDSFTCRFKAADVELAPLHLARVHRLICRDCRVKLKDKKLKRNLRPCGSK